MKRYRRLRRLVPDAELIRRRATGETLRQLALEYGVSHTTLSRYFARPQLIEQLKRAKRLQRAEQRTTDARWRAEQKAEHQARRKAKQQKAAEQRRAAGRAPGAPSPAKRPSVAETARSGDSSARSSSAKPAASPIRVGLAKRKRASDPQQGWLDTRKNLSGRARAEASGLVRLSNPEATVASWVEAAEAPALLEAGWTPA